MTVLDLLSAIGSLPSSSEGGFKEAVRVISGQDNVLAHRRNLEGLGHVKFDYRAGQIYALAPRLVSLPRKNKNECVAVLAGARNSHLLSELGYLSGTMRVSMETVELGNGLPTRISFGGTSDALQEMAHKCASLPLSIAQDPATPDAWRLLSDASSLQSIIDRFTSQTTGIDRAEPSSSDEVFNPASGYYDPWSRVDHGYQSSYIVWRKSPYEYRLSWWDNQTGTWVRLLSRMDIDPLWARWAVVYSTDPAHALPYISGQGNYRIRRTNPLPMELHRVCCLCSGYPPTENDEFLEYRNVPPVIQQGVNDKLKVTNP